MKTKIRRLIKSMLKEGISLRKISLCLALGVALGIFPVLGMTTLLCTIAAFILRLNMPAIQAVNFIVYPLQIILLAPFYGAGSWLFGGQGRHIISENLIDLLQNDFWGGIVNLWDLTFYAIFTWLMVTPLLILLLYGILKPVIGSMAVFRVQSGRFDRN
jgi:uncharacterized protein (DUF2062 family)